jgi:hypothetical protein
VESLEVSLVTFADAMHAVLLSCGIIGGHAALHRVSHLKK